MTIILRRVLAAAACLLWAWWGIAQVREGTRREQLRRQLADDPAGLLENRDRLTNPEAFLALVDHVSEDFFPPDRRTALEAAEGAVAAEPLWSRPWMVLARQRLLLGDDEGARRALLQADALEPRYPRQRLESVRLWTLLGNRRAGIAVAREVAALGDRHRIDAAGELLVAGLEPAQVFLLLGGEELAPGPALELARALQHPDAGAMERLHAVLPGRVLADPEVRPALAALALDPLDSAHLLQLWHLESEPPGTATGGVLLANPGLESPPFFNRFPLGWLPPPDRGTARIQWLAADESGEPGRIRVDFAPFGNVVMRYDVYRLLLPAGQGANLRVRMRWGPAGQLETELSARPPGGGAVARVRLPLEAPEWQDVPLEIPAAGEDRIINLVLEVRRPGDETDWTEAAIELDSLDTAPSGTEVQQ